jgi:O-antigen ligase
MSALSAKRYAVWEAAKRWCAKPFGMAMTVVIILIVLWLLNTLIGRIAYLFWGGIALAALFLIVKYPIIGVCFSAFSITSSISIFLPRTVSVTLLVTTTALLIRKLLMRDATWRVTPVTKWGIVLFAWWTFSILWGNYYDYFSFENFYRVVLVLLIFSEVIRTPNHYVSVVMAAGVGIAFSAISTVHSVIEFFHSGTYEAIANMTSRAGAARFGGHWADFNYMAIATVPFIGLVFAVFRSRTHILLRAPAGLFFICGIVSVFLSLSRAGILCLIIMFAIIIIADKRRMLWLLGLSLIISAFLLVLPVDIGGRLTTLFKPQGDVSLRQRTQLAQSGLKSFSEHWLFGIGMSNYRVNSSDYIWNLPSEMLVHNSFLEVGVESGIAGFILLCGTISAALLRTKPRTFRIEAGDFAQTLFVCQSAAVIAIVFGMMTLNATNFIPLWLLFTLCGIAPAVFVRTRACSVATAMCCT